MNDAFKPVNDKSLSDINAANRDMWDAGKPNSQDAGKPKTPEAHAKSAKYYGEQVTSALKKYGNIEPAGARSLATRAAHHGKKALGQDGEMDLPSKEIGKRAGKRAEKIGGQDASNHGVKNEAIFQRRVSEHLKKNPHLPRPEAEHAVARGAQRQIKKQKDESDPQLSQPSTEVGAKDAEGPLRKGEHPWSGPKKLNRGASGTTTSYSHKQHRMNLPHQSGRNPGPVPQNPVLVEVHSGHALTSPFGKSGRTHRVETLHSGGKTTAREFNNKHEAAAYVLKKHGIKHSGDATMEQIQHRARIKRIVNTDEEDATGKSKFTYKGHTFRAPTKQLARGRAIKYLGHQQIRQNVKAAKAAGLKFSSKDITTNDPGEGTHTAKFDRCVEEVKGSGKNAYAICMSSIGKNEALK